MIPFNLTGKRAIITGGASGIGLATVHAFAEAGARVTILDLDAAKASAATSSISAECIACDVTSPASVEAAFTQAAATGPIDLLVNSAGIAHVGTLLSTTPEDFDRLYNVNVRGTFLCMQSAVQRMQTSGGAIVNLASIAATTGLADRFAYSMTKGAVLSMTLSVARDYIAQNIRCNCISPARVHTPFVDGFVARTYPGHEEEMFAKLAASQPIGRMGRPDEIAWLILYLCTDAASFLTGCDYPIDGGYFNLR